MDRELTKAERRVESRRKIIRIGCAVGLPVLAIVGVMLMLDSSIKGSDLTIGKVEIGTLESSVGAAGKIVPLYEQAIVSPVGTKIMEVYCNEGDHVEAGQSLVRLDLQQTETELRRLADEVSMTQNEIEQTRLNNDTYLTDLHMRIRAKEMAVSHLKEEVANERRLDSIGSGTGDRIREAELAYSTGRLELEQMRTQLENERRSRDASLRSKQLQGSISRRNMEDMQRTIDDARVPAPREGTVTFLNKNIGTSIGAGEKLAVVSDLSHFKITGEIPENNSGKLAIGSTVNVRINREMLRGHIGNVSPQSIGGMVEFTVLLDDDTDPLLRSGLRTELNVVYDVQEDVVRIPNGSYFQGPGDYRLFVRTAPDRLERRNVSLGDSNFDYVEVKSGLAPGEEVVLTDMGEHRNKSKLKIK